MSDTPIPRRRGTYGAHPPGFRPNRPNLVAIDGGTSGDERVISDNALIEEAVYVNHKQVSDRTADTYHEHLRHYAEYLSSACEVTALTAERSHVIRFLSHLGVRGGENPDGRRAPCSWCRDRSYPDGRDGAGWSASRRKSYLAAIRFLYRHVIEEKHLPDMDPTIAIDNPTLAVVPQFVPTREEVRAFFEAPGSPRDRLLAHWMYWAPSRRETFRQARWEHIIGLNTDDARWVIPKAKGGRATEFPLHPALRNELRRYQHWQQKEAEHNRALRIALLDSATAFILLTDTGKQVHASTLTKMIKWRGVRAGIGLARCASDDAVDGWTSKLTPHALRRAWADHALNDPENPWPLDVVAEVLDHADTSTTRKHYARTKQSRAANALRSHRL